MNTRNIELDFTKETEEEGLAARLAGYSEHMNPYPAGRFHDAWDNGYFSVEVK